MRFLVVSLLAALLLTAPPARAAKPLEAESDRQMLASNVAAPVVRNGRLVNYLFVTVQVDLAAGANVPKVRDRAHFLRDALLRAAHRTSLADPTLNNELNKTLALSVFKTAASEALGASNVKGVSIVGVDSLRRR